MPSQRIKFTVGLFVASGIAIAVIAVIWLGMSRFLEKGQYYATYFNESVQGLNRDSPVKYRGVSIGRVEKVDVAPDSRLIEVILKIESGQQLDNQIVTQLKSVGITGSMFIELDRKKAGEPDASPLLTFPSEYPIVASKPSEITQLLRGIDDVLNQIRSLDLEGISDRVKLVLETTNQTILDANVRGISANVTSSLEDIRTILARDRWEAITRSLEQAGRSLNSLMKKADNNLNITQGTLTRVEKMVADNERNIRSAIEDFGVAMKNATAFLKQGASLVDGADASFSDLSRHLLVTAQNLERASENLNRLTELLAENPSQLLFGEPPQPRKLQPD